MFLFRWKVVAVLAIALFATSMLHAQVLVDNPFLTSYDGWVSDFDGFTVPDEAATRLYEPNWGILLGEGTLAENSDGFVGGLADGDFQAFNMVQPAGVNAASVYTLNATFMASDDDGLGLIFGYQDADNFFRVTSRPGGTGQACPGGVSVQRVVAGVGTTIGTSAATLTPFDDTAFDLTVAVDGTSYDVIYDGSSIISGTDAALAAGGYGVLSWGQRHYNTSAHTDRGTQVSQVTMTAGTEVTTHTFTDTGAVSWRELTMAKSDGATITTGSYQQNFIANFVNGTIVQDSNGFGYATETAPNADFIAPSVVVDDPTSDMWTDYEVKVRMQNGDDDGMGLLFRVQGDDSFYRVEFTMQSMGTSASRPPQGMSIQKCVAGVWTELYRDTQGSSPFVYAKDIPFDVTVSVVGNEIDVQVIDDPDGAAMVIDYPTVVDADSSLMYGSVGLTVWGSGEATNGGIFSAYGGQAGPLVVAVPEPSTIILVLMGVLMLVLRRRSR